MKGETIKISESLNSSIPILPVVTKKIHILDPAIGESFSLELRVININSIFIFLNVIAEFKPTSFIK